MCEKTRDLHYWIENIYISFKNICYDLCISSDISAQKYFNENGILYICFSSFFIAMNDEYDDIMRVCKVHH